MDEGLLWGKTVLPDGYHPLLCHLLDVAAVTLELLDRYPLVADMPKMQVAYLAALHDIGKADAYFQNKAPDQVIRLKTLGMSLPISVNKFRHEARSAEWASRHFISECSWDNNSARVASTILRGHHGNFRSGAINEDKRDPLVQQFVEMRINLAKRVRDALGIAENANKGFLHAGAAGVRLSGLLILADWVASNEKIYRYPQLSFDGDDKQYWNAAREEAKFAVAKLIFAPSNKDDSVAVSFASLWPECTKLRPTQNALQQILDENPPPPGLAIIEAPMGEGKTEAAITLAEQWRRTSGREGVYIALPTGATSNQMHSRYSAFLQRIRPGVAPRLVHGMAWLIDDHTPEEETPALTEEEREAQATRREWFRPSKRALLEAEAVGTVDQALMAALNVKFGVLRLFGLANKVLIIDEAHAYDDYMTTIMCRLLTWCRVLEIPVILLSATLSAKQRNKLVAAYQGREASKTTLGNELTPYPLLTFVESNEEVKEIAVPRDKAEEITIVLSTHQGLLLQPNKIAELALEEIMHGGCACILMNTVGEAQAVFAALKDIASEDVECLLFHARFRAEDRQRLEKCVTTKFGKDGTRPDKAVLVATQVVEQSLDVDFDVMISALAPIDLLLQRCGRLWRHQRSKRPIATRTLHVALPKDNDFGGTGKVYRHAPLWHTIALLNSRNKIELPHDFRPLIEGCYGPVPFTVGLNETVLEAAYKKMREDEEKEEGLAKEHLIAEPKHHEFIFHVSASVGEDEDGAANDYLHASTRLGRTTRPTLVLHDAELLKLAQSDTPPPRDSLRSLFLQKVDLPAWWFNDLLTEEGTPVDLVGPDWLHGHLVLPMVNRKWKARGKKGEEIMIIDSPECGIIRHAGKESEDDF